MVKEKNNFFERKNTLKAPVKGLERGLTGKTVSHIGS